MDSNGFVYRYVAEVHPSPGAQPFQVPLDVDWMPALESAWFEAARLDGSATAGRPAGAGHVEPVWAREGEPYLRHVRASVPGAGGAMASVDVPLLYFEDPVRARLAELMQQGRMAETHLVEYKVCAFRARETEPAARLKPRLAVEEDSVPIPIDGEEALDELLRDAIPADDPKAEAELVVAVHGGVLQEAVRATRQAGPVEAGGVLVGHLRRDRARRDRVIAVVTAQVPAQGAKQELCELTFTRDTWVAVDQALALRRGGEVRLGYWHSHPARYWCRNCPPENQKVCKMSGEFFSAQDKLLLRTVFPRAHSLGLLISDSLAKGVTWTLFGWRRGLIVRRGFYLLGRLPEIPELPVETGGNHEPSLAERACRD